MTLNTRFNLWVSKTFDCFPIPPSKQEQHDMQQRANGRGQVYMIIGVGLFILWILKGISEGWTL